MHIEIKEITSDQFETAYTLTRELMEYHNALDIFTMTCDRFSELVSSGSLMSKIIYADGKPAGIMNFFWKLTTFTGRKILYIEDFYVRKEYRGMGLGKALLESARLYAAENDCEQIELKCAAWNEKSARFYEGNAMRSEKDWIVYTLDKSLF